MAKNGPNHPSALLHDLQKDPPAGGITMPAPTDLANGVRLENVLAYLNRRFEQACNVHATPSRNTPAEPMDAAFAAENTGVDAAEKILRIAHISTAMLGQLLESQPERLAQSLMRSPPFVFPLMIKRTDWPKKLVKLAGIRKPNKRRADIAKGMAEHMEREATRLYQKWQEWRQRAGKCVEDDRDDFPQIPFTMILDKEGEEEAFAYLPPPSSRTFHLWWNLEEAILKRLYEPKNSFWFVHEDILRGAERSTAEQSGPQDSDQARRTIAQNYEASFIQALRRLAV